MSQGGCGPTGMADCPPFPGPPYTSFNPPSSSYVVNSKIMVVAVAVLFGVVVFILCLHVYAKWFWRNQGALGATDGTLRTVSWQRRRRRDATAGAMMGTNPLVVVQSSVGLEKAVIAALPTFEFDAKAGAPLECAVCLEEFEAGETGRTLPKCGHHFHVDCVDMWLHSHSTCPLCRTSVRLDEKRNHPHPDSHPVDAHAVIGDVHAPFMAAMRASRRRQRSRGSFQLPNPLNSSLAGTTVASIPPMETPPTTQSSLTLASATNQDSLTPTNQDSSPPTATVDPDPKVLALEYETPTDIPSNVLFWGGNNNHNETPGAQQPSASERIHAAPFQVSIDIPSAAGSQSSGNVVMSPMARASASFRRLLSRGKSVVSPQDDGFLAADEEESGPSSPPPHHHHQAQMPPSPPNAS